MATVAHAPIRISLSEGNIHNSDILEIAFHLMMGESIIILHTIQNGPLADTVLSKIKELYPINFTEIPDGYLVDIEEKKFTPYSKNTIGGIVAKDIRLARAFIDHKIDFCCGGKELLADVCHLNMLDLSKVVRDLVSVSLNLSDTSNRLPTQDPVLLTKYIQETHHAYIRNNFPMIMSFMYKVSAVHGRQHSELLRIRTMMLELQEELLMHLDKEEQVLFPMIRKLFGAPTEDDAICNIAVTSVQFPIARMISEHESAGEVMHVIEELTNHYTCPTDACESYRFLYDSLKLFFDDLQVHIHLENNVLFPAAVEREHLLS